MKLRNIKDFIEVYRNVDYYFKPLDQAILRACKKIPDHNNKNEVFAKIALVNRTYRANLNLGAKNAEWHLAEKFVDKNIDNELSPLKNIRRFNLNSIERVVQTHEKLIQIAYTITKRVENSFSSKYLSFHFPKIVPIYDSYSYATSWRLIGNQVKATRYDENWNYDYGYHCEAILLLVEALLSNGIQNPDLKLVDCVLYGEG